MTNQQTTTSLELTLPWPALAMRSTDESGETETASFSNGDAISLTLEGTVRRLESGEAEISVTAINGRSLGEASEPELTEREVRRMARDADREALGE